jgi:hypothetical protein
VVPGLGRPTFTRRAKPAPNLSHQRRIVSSLRDFLRGVAHDNAALEQQRFDVAKTQLEAKIPALGAADNGGRKAMTVIARFSTKRTNTPAPNETAETTVLLGRPYRARPPS